MTSTIARRSIVFAGRDDDVDAVHQFLTARFADDQRRTRLLTIEGPAGIGKSRLVDESRRSLDPNGRWLQIRCSQYRAESGSPIMVGLERLRDGAPRRRTDRDTGGTIGPDVSPTVSFERRLVDEILVEADRGLSVIAIDDLQWADGATLDVIRRLLDESDPADVGLAILATIRTMPDPIDPIVGSLLRHRLASRLTLTGLTPAAGAELLVAAGAPITLEDTLEGLSVLVDGNPLLLEEIALKLAALGSTSVSRLTDVAGVAAMIEMPQGVAEEARGVVDRLEPDLRGVLTVVALLVSMTEDEAIDLLDRLEIANASTLLEQAEDAGLVLRGGEIRLRHPSLDHALLATAPPSRMRQLHRDVASALLDQMLRSRRVVSASSALGRDSSTLAIEIVHHARLGGVPLAPELFEMAVLARSAAMERNDWLQVIRVAEYMANAATGNALGRTLLDQGIAQFMLGELASGDTLARAADHLDPEIDLDGHVVALLGRSRADGTFRIAHPTDDSRGSVETELEGWLVDLDGDRPDLCAELLADLAFSAWVRWDMDAARERADECLSLRDDVDATTAFARALTCRGLAEYTQCRITDSLASLREACAYGARAGPLHALTPQVRLPYALLGAGRVRDACRESTAALDAMSVMHVTSLKMFAGGIAVVAAEACGQYDAAAAMWRALRNWGAGNREVMATANAGLASALGLSSRGRTAAALHRLDEALTPLLGPGCIDRDPTARGLAAIVRSEDPTGLSGDPPDVVLRIDPTSLDVVTLTNAVVEVELARLAHRVPGPEVVEVLERSLGGGVIVGTGLAVLIQRSLGSAAAARGEREAAIDLLRSALYVARRENLPAEQARTMLALLEGALVEVDESHRLRQELGDLVVESGLVGFLPRLDALDAALGASIRSDLARSADSVEADEAVVLLVDIVNSTRWTIALGSVDYRALARGVERQLRRAVNAHGGRIGAGINLGDGVVAEFRSVDAALGAGVEMLHRLTASSLQIRVGVHVGEVAREGNVISGTAINIAARACDLAAPAGMLVTDAVAAMVGDTFRGELVDEGEHHMKGLDEPMRVWSHPSESVSST